MVKIIKEVWSSSQKSLIPLEEALKRNCKLCGSKLALSEDSKYVVCTRGCGKIPISTREVIEGREWVVKTLLRGRIVEVAGWGEDGTVYKLTVRLPQDVWKKVSKYFWYAKNDEDVEGLTDFWDFGARGWVTCNAEEVNKIVLEEAKKAVTQKELEEVEYFRRKEEEERKEIQEYWKKWEESKKKWDEEKKKWEEEKKRMHEEFQKKVKEISEEWVNVSWKHHEIAKKINPNHEGFKTIIHDPITNEKLWVSEQDPNIYCICGEFVDIIYHKMPKNLVEKALDEKKV